MNVYQELLLLILVLYGVECVAWVRDEESLFLSWWGGPARCLGPGFRLKNPVPLGHACRAGAPGGSRDSAAADRRWRAFLERSDALQVLSTLLFFLPFAGLGLFLWRPYLYSAWLVLAALFLILHFSVGPLFFRAHRELYPGLGSERFFQTFLCVLSPLQSARATDLLARDLMTEFDPLVTAAVLASPEEFRRAARRRWREARFPAGGGAALSDGDLERWIKDRGVGAAALSAPPARAPFAKRFCERCDDQYMDGRDRCPACERPLAAFPA